MNNDRKLVAESRLIDFANDLPLRGLTKEQTKKLWSDHLHLTAAGYDLMAEIIYKKVKIALELFFQSNISEKRS